jgi:hypothetical protein
MDSETKTSAFGYFTKKRDPWIHGLEGGALPPPRNKCGLRLIETMDLERLRDTSLDSIDLSQSDLMEGAGVAIRDALMNNTRLMTLDLSRNKLKCTDIEEIVKALGVYNKCLLHLDLSFNIISEVHACLHVCVCMFVRACVLCMYYQ